MEAPRPVPEEMFSNQPFHSCPGWPQLISKTIDRGESKQLLVEYWLWAKVIEYAEAVVILSMAVEVNVKGDMWYAVIMLFFVQWSLCRW